MCTLLIQNFYVLCRGGGISKADLDSNKQEGEASSSRDVILVVNQRDSRRQQRPWAKAEFLYFLFYVCPQKCDSEDSYNDKHSVNTNNLTLNYIKCIDGKYLESIINMLELLDKLRNVDYGHSPVHFRISISFN